jgi:pseudouridine kinase
MPEITVIGDATIDHFLTIPEDSITTYCKIPSHTCELTLPYGAKVPAERSELKCGGNAANIAVGLTRLGKKVHAIIPLGTDMFSHLAHGILEKEDVSIPQDLINSENACNFHTILRYAGERTIFTYHTPKHYQIPTHFDTKYVYFSSHSGDHGELTVQVLQNLGSSKLLFAPSNVQIKGDKDLLEALVAKSNLLICNKQEAFEILKKIDNEELEINKMMHTLSHFGAHHVVITDGANGVDFLDGDTGVVAHIDSTASQSEVVDSTGAGDSMATGVIFALMEGKNIETGCQIGMQNSQSVIMKVGSQDGLLRKNELK